MTAPKTLLAALGFSAIAGCSSTPEQVVTERLTVFESDNRSYIHSIETTTYGNNGLGGAVVRMPGVIHVLGDSRPSADAFVSERDQNREKLLQVADLLSGHENVSEIDGSTLDKAMAVIAEIDSSDPTQRLSHYDMALWNKFCAGGNDLTQDDWGQMLSVSLDQMPASLAGNCTMPPLELDESIISRYCADEALTNKERFIVRLNNESSVAERCDSL